MSYPKLRLDLVDLPNGPGNLSVVKRKSKPGTATAKKPTVPLTVALCRALIILIRGRLRKTKGAAPQDVQGWVKIDEFVNVILAQEEKAFANRPCVRRVIQRLGEQLEELHLPGDVEIIQMRPRVGYRLNLEIEVHYQGERLRLPPLDAVSVIP